MYASKIRLLSKPTPQVLSQIKMLKMSLLSLKTSWTAIKHNNRAVNVLDYPWITQPRSHATTKTSGDTARG